jgi:hypothetical protein
MGANQSRRTQRLPHRGATGNPLLFAQQFLVGRLEGFTKDMGICLTGIPDPKRPGRITHAYFPALASCCGMLEYMTMLYLGEIRTRKAKDIQKYVTAYLPGYTTDTVRILWDAFRNTVAHRSIATGVWVDHDARNGGRRCTWSLHADATHPFMEVLPQKNKLIYESPWECEYTHRVHIHLGRLWRDIRDSVERYSVDVAAQPQLLANFMKSMRDIYPPA